MVSQGINKPMRYVLKYLRQPYLSRPSRSNQDVEICHSSIYFILLLSVTFTYLIGAEKEMLHLRLSSQFSRKNILVDLFNQDIIFYLMN